MGLYPKDFEPGLNGLPLGPNSNVYFVDAANGDDDNKGTSRKTPLATIAAAYAKCTAGQNDVVAVIAGTSGNTLSAALDWAKDYTHLVGLCAPTRAAQRARIFQLSTLTGASPLLTVSADGCIFRDLYVFQGVNDATSLINISVTGGRNYFENVHFAGGGHASHAINNGASLKLDGAEENTFVRCTIGVDTIGAATGFVGLLLDGGAKRNQFEGCLFRMEHANNGAAFVEVADATAITHDNIFDGCVFTNNSSTVTTAAAFLVPAVTTGGRLLLKDCMFNRVAKLDANDRGVLFGNMGAVTGADLSGVAVEMVST